MLKKTGIFSPYTFAMGDTVVVAFVQNVAFMPMCAARVASQTFDCRRGDGALLMHIRH